MAENGTAPDPAQVLALLQEALALDPSDHGAFLDRLGETSADLRAEVEELLKHDRSGSSAMLVENLAAATRAQATDQPELPPENDTRARYESLGEIARGGMGRIECTHDRTLARDIARKIALPPRNGGEAGSTALRRFLAEARVTGQLEHPGVVPVHELGVGSDGEVYFTMRLVRGRDFEEILGQVHGPGSSWTTTRALGVLQRVCETMAFAHDQGVVHRDLKPANVMIGCYGEVYVMDWGLARVRGYEDVNTERLDPAGDTGGYRPSSRTAHGTVLGTPYYMPPEQARGQTDRVDERSDVYAVGAMLYHVLAGQPPYAVEGWRRPARDVVAAVCETAPRPLARAAPEVAPELVSICEKAMAREPAQRFRSITELAEELRAYLETRVVRSHRTGAAAELHKWIQRNRGLSSAIGATVLAVVLGLVAVSQVEAAGRRAAEIQAGRIARLTAVHELAALEDRARQLWPPHPERIAAYERWVADAQALLRGLDEPSSDSVPGHREQLRLLREQGQLGPRPPELGPHPLASRLEYLRTKLDSLRHARTAALGGPEQSSDPLPDTAHLSPSALAKRAWALIKPNRMAFGFEPQGLALARLAMERHESAPETSDAPASELCNTLAFACLSVGRLGEALKFGRQAVARCSAERKPHYRSQFERLCEEVDCIGSVADPDSMRELEREIAELEAATSQSWHFPEKEVRRWHDLLGGLIHSLERFGDEVASESAEASPSVGWPVPKRLAFARELAARADRPKSVRDWERARAAIASSGAYAGLDLPAQLGLQPLGPDPASGLWEFAHLQSGEPAERRADGSMKLTADTGVVLVLIPGGTFHMGAQAINEDEPGFDANADADEGPVRRVTLDPFFLSKFEVSQAQWMRATGANPSFYRHGGRSARGLDHEEPLLHPVETISWPQGHEVLGWMDLELPTEAQWEYAVRAGTTGSLWTGTDLDHFHEAEKLLRPGQVEVHRRVDHGLPNGFGLLNMAGNVFEWCADTYVQSFYSWGPGHNPRCEVPDENRVIRGAHFHHLDWYYARSAMRNGAVSTSKGNAFGLRPARAIRP